MNEFKLGPKQEKWLQALESGRYEQGHGRLCWGNRFCCLGVAKEVLGLGESSNTALKNTYEELGLRSDSGEMRQSDPTEPTSLVHMNDGRGSTFKEIAAYIRANPEKVFLEGK